MKNVLHYLAYHSFLIINIMFSLSFMTLIILHYFVYDKLPYFVLYLFFMITGVFIGYRIAYYSIKHLQSEKES
jgi:hypothetical protein